MSSVSVLGLVSAQVLVGEVSEGGFFREPQVRDVVFDFDCWAIDGKSIFSMVEGDHEVNRGVVTVFCDSGMPSDLRMDSLRALLQLPPLGEVDVYMADGRVALLYCRCCADLNCATLSAEIIIEDDVVQWRDIAWQVDYEKHVPDPIPWNWINAIFDRVQYESFIKNLISDVCAVAE